jgi:hypothetical protein
MKYSRPDRELELGDRKSSLRWQAPRKYPRLSSSNALPFVEA